jgi:hypothetical protein
MCSVEAYQQSDPLVGAVLDGRYRVEPMIATGGMSAVYRGLDCGWTGRGAEDHGLAVRGDTSS